jgi:hypothetical protein
VSRPRFEPSFYRLRVPRLKVTLSRSEANSCSPSQEIFLLFMEGEVDFSVHKNPLLISVLSYSAYCLEMRFNIIPLCVQVCQVLPYLRIIPSKLSYIFVAFVIRTVCLPSVTLLGIITSVAFHEAVRYISPRLAVLSSSCHFLRSHPNILHSSPFRFL